MINHWIADGRFNQLNVYVMYNKTKYYWLVVIQHTRWRLDDKHVLIDSILSLRLRYEHPLEESKRVYSCIYENWLRYDVGWTQTNRKMG